MSRVLLSLFLAASPGFLLAAPPSIGFVKSTGEFRLDGSAIRGNSTLFEGSLVETAAARSTLQLAGVQITLAPESRARVFRDRTVLEKGSGTLKDAAAHVLEAQSLRIAPASRESVVQVDIAAPRVSLVARAGSAQVRTASGMLVANVPTGVALAIDPQGGASTDVQLSGTLKEAGGRYLLTDSITGITVELQGAEVAKFAGKCVEVNGSSVPGAAPAPGASQVVHPVSLKAVSCSKPVAGGAGSRGAAAGLSHGAQAAIIGGVAVAGTLVGLAAAGTFSGGPALSQP